MGAPDTGRASLKSTREIKLISLSKSSRVLKMGANSATRRLIKGLLYRVMNDHTYRYMQAVSKAWDIRSGSWSEPELELIPFAIKPGETVFDIGANFGLWCYHLSPYIGDGQIYAFEPVPFTHQTLKQIARLL